MTLRLHSAAKTGTLHLHIAARTRFVVVLLSMLLQGNAAADIPIPDQLKITDETVGTGLEVKVGRFAVLHYVGWVFDPAAPDGKGHQFADSHKHLEPLSYVYGYQRAVKGLERGLKGMRVGGKRLIVVPPKMGYDGVKHSPPPDVPENAALIFEVELLEVIPQAAPTEQ